MVSSRASIIGFGTSVLGLFISYALYKALMRSKKKGAGNAVEEAEEAEISPPAQFKTKGPPKQETKQPQASNVERKAVVEEMIMPASSNVAQALPKKKLPNAATFVRVNPPEVDDLYHDSDDNISNVVEEGYAPGAANLNNSQGSDDSMSGCPSITTDSGIGLTNSSQSELGSGRSHLPPENGDHVRPSPTSNLEVKEDSILPSVAVTVDTSVPEQPVVNGTATKAVVKQNGGTENLPHKRIVHRFLMPESLCGIFIGKKGRNVGALKYQTDTNISVSREPVLSTLRYCTIEGDEANVQKALRLIGKQYPDVDTTHADKLIPPPGSLSLSADRMQLQLPIGVLLDVVISHIVSAGHVFVQQPTHPAFNSWQRLDFCMNKAYADGSAAPPLPANVEDAVLCVAPINGRWFRAQIMSFSEDRRECEVKLMDVGGYTNINTQLLRQIRADFLSLPLQAVECYLANIEPLDGEAFSAEAGDALRLLTCDQIVQCQPVASDESNIPFIHIISHRNKQAIVVNSELANKGLVKWYDLAQ